MFKSIRMVVVLLVLSNACYADNKWFELSAGVLGESLQYKSMKGRSGWALQAGRYDEIKIFGTSLDRKTGESITESFNALSVSKVWYAPFGWGFADVGIGLGLAEGTWKGNCTDEEEPVIFAVETCDVTETVSLAIPIQATAVLGKYLGLGISPNVIIHSEGVDYNISLTIPFGKFTK